MKTFRVYLKCCVHIEANSKEEAEEVANEMDYSFSHNGDDLEYYNTITNADVKAEFASEIYDLEQIQEIKN